MLEKLREKYPGRYSLPGENEKRTEISSSFQMQKASRASSTRARNSMPWQYETYITSHFQSHLQCAKELLKEEIPAEAMATLSIQTFTKKLLAKVTPAEVLAKVKNEFSNETGALPDDFPSDSAINSKVAALKQKEKALRDKMTLMV